MKVRVKKIAAGAMLLLLLVGLIPVMYLGRYNHPTGDDYYYGAATHQIWQETGSLAATVAEAAKGVALEYDRWQGTYSALFLMYLPPNVFGNFPYRLVTAVILILLVGSIFYVSRQLLCGYMRMSAWDWVIISSVIALLCVETVPTPGESFFWYNGSMYYTGYFAVTLFLLGLALKYAAAGGVRRLLLLLLLAAFLGGGNYVSLLPCLLLLFFLGAGLLREKRKTAWGIVATELVMLEGLFISATAPGSRVRQEGMWRIPAWKAILKSLFQGLRYAGAWTGIGWLLAAAVITPLLWRHFRKNSLRFSYPLVVIGLIYGIFCSMSCPTFYTMNSTGPARAVAIVYYGFVLSTFLAYGYLLGYLHRVRRERHAAAEKKSEVRYQMGAVVGAAGLAVVAVVLFAVTGELSKCTTVKAIRLLASGEAQGYEQEYQERYRILTDENVQVVELEPYVNQPELLYVGDFSGDAHEPTNVQVAVFFGKQSVRVNYE